MIVISGALVLVALILLVIGLVDPSLGFVYASIGVSLAAFAFLVVGILQRRKEELPGAETPAVASDAPGLAAASEGITTLSAVPARRPAASALSGSVLVVTGRPRYHVGGCRYLTGKDAASLDIAEAQTEGYTACGVCKPDENLTSTGVLDLTAVADEPEAAQEAAVVEKAPVRAAKAAPSRVVTSKVAASNAETVPATSNVAAVSKATATPKVAAPAKASATAAPAKAAPAKAAPAKVAPVKAAKAAPAAAKAAPARTASAAKAAPAAKAPAKDTVSKAAPAKPAVKAASKAAPVKRAGVIVIPDRGKFHTPDCRYVRGAEGTLELTKAAASKQGYEACGVCNP